MIVFLDLEKNICTVTKESGDKKFYRSEWALAESGFLHQVKLALIEQGFDVIKKRMWKDGNLVDDIQQYVRTRKWTSKDASNEWAIYNSNWAIYDLGEQFNELDVGKLISLEVLH